MSDYKRFLWRNRQKEYYALLNNPLHTNHICEMLNISESELNDMNIERNNYVILEKDNHPSNYFVMTSKDFYKEYEGIYREDPEYLDHINIEKLVEEILAHENNVISSIKGSSTYDIDQENSEILNKTSELCAATLTLIAQIKVLRILLHDILNTSPKINSDSTSLAKWNIHEIIIKYYLKMRK